MRKTIAGFVTLGVAMVVTSSAFAQSDMGAEGSMALSADRLFGITSYNVTSEVDLPGAVEVEDKGTVVSLAWGAPANVDGVPIPGMIPRLSFDYFVIDDLSLGGSVGVVSFSGEHDTGAGSVDYPDVTAFAFAPRVGYIFHISDSVGFWLRGGFTYFSYDREDAYSGSTLQLNAEGIFAFAITDSFAFTAGPAVDLPLTGSFEPDGDDPDTDVKIMSIGAYGGLMGWF